MPAFAKSLLRSAPVQRALAWVIAVYIRLVWHSGRWEVRGEQPRDDLARAGTPVIVGLWHNRILMMPYAWRGQRSSIQMLVSAHRDGMMVTRTMALFNMIGIPVGKGAARAGAVKTALRTLKEGRILGITPDGPRGPRMRVKAGITDIARLSGATIVPVTYAARWRLTVDSWDRFVVPLPFSRGLVLWGDPIPMPEGTDPAAWEAARLTVEDAMIALAALADREVGSEPTVPAPPLDPAEA